MELAAQTAHTRVDHVAEAAHADVELGFVVVDHAFHGDLAPRHGQPAPLVDHIDRKQRTLLLRFGDGAERAGQRQQDSDFDALWLIRAGNYRREHAGHEHAAKQASSIDHCVPSSTLESSFAAIATHAWHSGHYRTCRRMPTGASMTSIKAMPECVSTHLCVP
jgi:hypothetical protein